MTISAVAQLLCASIVLATVAQMFRMVATLAVRRGPDV